MKRLNLFAALLVFALLAQSCPNPGQGQAAVGPALDWKRYLSTPTIDGSAASAMSGMVHIASVNPFADGTPVVLIGTPPTIIPPKAKQPY